ncbi:MAG: hypothetical protein HW421_1413 [Ignavibacteria bacterium]|nr:hypothetical protein [Ignavibacteria bacterium]
MNIGKPTTTNPLDYEILIRKKGEDQYAAYCPQLYTMLKGKEHEEVHDAMHKYITHYIEQLLKSVGELESGHLAARHTINEFIDHLK